MRLVARLIASVLRAGGPRAAGHGWQRYSVQGHRHGRRLRNFVLRVLRLLAGAPFLEFFVAADKDGSSSLSLQEFVAAAAEPGTVRLAPIMRLSTCLRERACSSRVLMKSLSSRPAPRLCTSAEQFRCCRERIYSSLVSPSKMCSRKATKMEVGSCRLRSSHAAFSNSEYQQASRSSQQQPRRTPKTDVAAS